MIERVSRELGRPCRLHRDGRIGAPAYQLQVDPRHPSVSRRGRTRDEPWYRQAKETKCGEMDGRESECPIVATKRGNGPRTPWSEGGAALWTGSWNHAEDIELPSVSPRNGHGSCEGQRIHNVTNRMPLRARPDLWEPWVGNPQGDPAPDRRLQRLQRDETAGREIADIAQEARERRIIPM